MARDATTDAGREHYVSPRKKRTQASAKMQPPLTPMIDVTFQLLLFFLLTMTFRLPEGMIPGALPQQGTSSASEAITEPIKVFIYPRNANRDAYYEIEGYGQEIDNAKDLYDVFMGRIEALGTREGPVVITPQARVRWQYVTEVFNQANRAQFENIGFAPAAS